MSRQGAVQIRSSAEAVAWIQSRDYLWLAHAAEAVIGSFDNDPNFTGDCVNRGVERLLSRPGCLVGKTVSDSYLLTVVCNIARDFIRDNRGRRESLPEDYEATAASAETVEGVAMRKHEAAVCLLLVAALDDDERKLYELHTIHGKSCRELASVKGVGKTWMAKRLSEIETGLQRDLKRFERGGLCEAHLEAGGELARVHIETCSSCRADIKERRKAARDIAVFFPAFLALPAPESSGHVLADMLARVEASASQIAYSITQRVQEASVATKAGAAVVASAVAIGTPVAITSMDTDNAKSGRQDNQQSAPTPESPALYDELPVQAPPAGPDKSEPQKQERRDVQEPADDVPALAPEAGAQQLSSEPPPAPPDSGSGGGSGDLAP